MPRQDLPPKRWNSWRCLAQPQLAHRVGGRRILSQTIFGTALQCWMMLGAYLRALLLDESYQQQTSECPCRAMPPKSGFLVHGLWGPHMGWCQGPCLQMQVPLFKRQMKRSTPNDGCGVFRGHIQMDNVPTRWDGQAFQLLSSRGPKFAEVFQTWDLSCIKLDTLRRRGDKWKTTSWGPAVGSAREGCLKFVDASNWMVSHQKLEQESDTSDDTHTHKTY